MKLFPIFAHEFEMIMPGMHCNCLQRGEKWKRVLKIMENRPKMIDDKSWKTVHARYFNPFKPVTIQTLVRFVSDY